MNIGYGICDYVCFLVGDSALVPSNGYTLQDFLLILLPINTLPFSGSASHPVYSIQKLIAVHHHKDNSYNKRIPFVQT